MTNGIDQPESLIVTPNDIHLEEKVTDTIPSDSISDIPNNNEDIPISTDEIPQ